MHISIKTSWHESFWTFLHTITFWITSDKNEEDIQNFINSLIVTIPCEECRKHYTELIKSHPLPFNNNDNYKYFKWSVDIHNTVNKQLNKPQISYEEAYMIWANIR